MKRVAVAALLCLVALTGAQAAAGRTLRSRGLTLSLPAGWHGLVTPGGLQAADFPLARRVRLSAGLVRVRRGHVHLMVANGGPSVPYLPFYRPARPPLSFTRRDVRWEAFEGFHADYFARRDVTIDGEMLDLLADLGPRPLSRSALRKANAVLATLDVPAPHVIRPRNRRVTSDGVSVSLLPGWSGHAEIPAGRFGARTVLRLARGRVRVTLLELTGAPTAAHLDLPLVLTGRNVLRHRSPPVARRVFSTSGRSFDLSVTVPSTGALGEANRLLATLRVVPRPWRFESCNLTLRVPGTWRVAVRPRSGCYPILDLRGPGVLVVLRELRAGDHAGRRILRRNGRRFRVEVTPVSARAKAEAVLSTLRVRARP